MRIDVGSRLYIQRLFWLAVALAFLLSLLFDIKTAAQTNSALPPTFDQNASLIETQNERHAPDIPTVRVPTDARSDNVRRPTNPMVRPYSREEVIALIAEHAAAYGVDTGLALRIATCESGLRFDARNPSSTASGVFQYLAGTWANTPAGRQGLSVFDARANVHMAIASIATTGTAPWNGSRHCWNI